MQETTTVQWDPIYEGHLPWYTRLFIIYLAVMLLVACFRGVRMVWHLRSLRKGAPAANGSWLAWDSCHARTLSIKNWSAMTFLFSFVVSSWNLADTLHVISMEKITTTAYLAGATAEVLTTFCFGMLVCASLYAVAFFCETLLMRYKTQQSVARPWTIVEKSG